MNNKLKKINLNKTRLGRKEKLLGLIAFLIILLVFTYAILGAVSGWFDTHTIKYNKVLEVIVRKPIEITERKAEVREIIKVINEIPNPVDLKTDTEKYIYEVFGIENYKLAIAIARAESGLREEAFNVNTNGSIDIGVFQINSVHFKKAGCSLKEVSTVKGNVDCAYSIFKTSGFNPWVAWKTGSFKNKYE